MSDQIFLEQTDAPLTSEEKGFDLVKRFTRRTELAKGGKCILYKAYDTELNQEIALKVLRSDKAGDDEEEKRFLREGRLSSFLAHQNLPKHFVFGESSKGDLFLAMELISRGQDLLRIAGDIHHEKRRWNLIAVLDIVMRLCDVLAYVHERGVVHRDLKCENIVISEQGHISLVDFGIAKVWSNNHGYYDSLDPTFVPTYKPSMTMTRPGVAIGTPWYMPPEQIADSASVTPSSDVFSLGAVFYELLAGWPLFAGETLADTFRMIREYPTPNVSEKKPERNLPPELDEICIRATQKDPTQRFSSTLEFKESIQRVHKILEINPMDNSQPLDEMFPLIQR